MFPLIQVMQQIRMLKQNPNVTAQFLYQQGAINQQQYNDMTQQGIAGNPEAIGQYMMNHGMMNRGQVQNAYQNQAMPIYNSMKQN